jgi:hypothetical protein
MIIPKRDHDKQAQFDRVPCPGFTSLRRPELRKILATSKVYPRICAAQLFRAAKLIDASDAGPISA